MRVFEFPIKVIGNNNKKKTRKITDYTVLFLYFAIENSSFSFIYFGTTQPQTECRLNFQNNFYGEGLRQN